MSDDFETKMARLKEQAGVREDQEIAGLLGIGKAALSERKRRDSFPEDKLFALMSKRPELKIDATYVLTGSRDAAPMERALSEQLATFAGRLAAQGIDVAQASKVLADGIQQSVGVDSARKAHYQLLEAYLNGVDDRTLQLITDVVVRIARDAEVQAQGKRLGAG